MDALKAACKEHGYYIHSNGTICFNDLSVQNKSLPYRRQYDGV